MTRRRAVDYVAILKHVKYSLFPNIEVAWQVLFSDFEYALIKAMKEVFPDVFHRGCEFHWAMALFKKVVRINSKCFRLIKKYICSFQIRDLCLWALYQHDEDVQKTIKQLFCLPYLPYEKIEEVFNDLRGTANEDLEPLFQYIDSTWINGSQWTPRSWSVFGMVDIRTNNDAEGLHNLWNQRGRPKMNFYTLTQMLYNEARELPLRMQMVAHNKLTREKRCATRVKDETLRLHWDGYKKREISLREMFDRIVTDIKSPSIDRSEDGLEYDRFIADQ